MYTNWPFTAKQTHILFTCLSFAKGGFKESKLFFFLFFIYFLPSAGGKAEQY